jgi:hypothetical protein
MGPLLESLSELSETEEEEPTKRYNYPKNAGIVFRAMCSAQDMLMV